MIHLNHCIKIGFMECVVNWTNVFFPFLFQLILFHTTQQFCAFKFAALVWVMQFQQSSTQKAPKWLQLLLY